MGEDCVEVAVWRLLGPALGVLRCCYICLLTIEARQAKSVTGPVPNSLVDMARNCGRVAGKNIDMEREVIEADENYSLLQRQGMAL